MRKLHFARLALLSMLMMLTVLPVGAQQYVSDINVLQRNSRPPTESSTLSPNHFTASLPDKMISGRSYQIKISNKQSDGAVIYKSSDENIAVVITDRVYAKKAGEVVITVIQRESAKYERREVKIPCVIHPDGIVEFRNDGSIWYAISTFDQLNTYRGTRHANLYLKANINAFATKDKWNWVDNTMIFDGNGHNIYNAKFPLFSENTGTIKNLKMTNADITDNDHLHTGVVCCINQGTISNVWVEGSVNNTAISSDGVRCGIAGGICGLNESTISNCLNKASVTAVGRLGPVTVGRVGGICAKNTGIISYCSSVGALTFKDRADNGISGGGTITNCYYLQGTLKEADGTVYNDINSMSAAAYASGEVTWLLNNKTNGKDGAWRQYNTATVKEPRLAYFDSSPLMKPVYSGFKGKSCERVYAFTSDGLSDKPSPHLYFRKTGVCMVCHKDYQPATKNSDGYYEIYTPGQLAWLSQQVRANENDYNAILMNDIDLSSVCSEKWGSWMPIGSFTDEWYRGTFNGNGHTIKNLYIANNEAYQGLFGYKLFGTIKNLRVYGTVSASKNVGMVCGGNDNGRIQGCISGSTTGGGTVSAKKNAGGIVGENISGEVYYCLNLATVSADEIAGGIVGYNKGYLRSCMNNNVTKNCGYIEGLSDKYGKIYDCYFYNEATAARDFTNWTLLAKLGEGWSQLYAKDGEDYGEAMRTLLPTDMSREFRSKPNFAYGDGLFFKCENLQLSDNMVIPFKWLLVKTANYTRKAPSTGSRWGTLCLPFDILSAKNDPTGLEAYDGFELSGSSLRLTSGPGKKIPAGTPVIVKTQDGSINYTINYESTRNDGYYQLVDKPLESTATGDKLVGVFEPTSLDVTQAAHGRFYYYLNSDKFWEATGTISLQAYRAYITSDTDYFADPAAAKAFTIEDATTAVEGITADDEPVVEGIYSLDGRKLNDLQHGVNIIKMSNGTTKKVIK